MKMYKGYKIQPDSKLPTMYVIKPEGRGSVVAELDGYFTGYKAAMEAIDYLEKSKERKNAKAKSTA